MRAGHEAGYSTAELEERALAVAGAIGLDEMQISVTPTLIEVSVGKLQSQRSYTIRVRPPSVDLAAIARLDELVQDVLDARLNADGAMKALDEAQADQLWRPWPLVLGAYALAGASLTPVLGGGSLEAAAAGIVGAVVGSVIMAGRRILRAEPIAAPVAAVAASFSATALAQLGLNVSSDLVTLAALVTLLPGLTLTIGMRARYGAPAVRSREHGKRSRPASGTRLRRRDRSLDRGQLVRSGRPGGAAGNL